MTGDKAAAWLTAAVIVFGAGGAWVSLTNRIDKVDAKIVAIQKTLGSTPCTAILNRQLIAIDKGRPDVRKALEGLSSQYGCIASQNSWFSPSGDAEAATKATALRTELNAVDMKLATKAH